MTYIKFINGDLILDTSDIKIEPIIKAFGTLIEKNGFDHGALACGVMPSPDFGYFELADRFWRASLSIYSFGATNCFWERGVGYAEPWLFNARHAIELYVKGFLLNSIWLEELQNDQHLSVNKGTFINLSKEFKKPHSILEIYNDYLTRITQATTNWSTGINLEKPDINLIVLKPTELDILKEIDNTDETSFRFRYPSLKHNKTQNTSDLQEINWKHDPSMLHPITGLPKQAGYFFDHILVINQLTKLVDELKSIEKYFKAIGDYQDFMNDQWYSYLSDFVDEGI